MHGIPLHYPQKLWTHLILAKFHYVSVVNFILISRGFLSINCCSTTLICRKGENFKQKFKNHNSLNTLRTAKETSMVIGSSLKCELRTKERLPVLIHVISDENQIFIEKPSTSTHSLVFGEDWPTYQLLIHFTFRCLIRNDGAFSVFIYTHTKIQLTEFHKLESIQWHTEKPLISQIRS